MFFFRFFFPLFFVRSLSLSLFFLFFARLVPSLPSALSLSLSLSPETRILRGSTRGIKTNILAPPTDFLEGSKEERTPVHAYNFRVVALSQSLWNNDRRNGCFVRPIFTNTEHKQFDSISYLFFSFFCFSFLFL